MTVIYGEYFLSRFSVILGGSFFHFYRIFDFGTCHEFQDEAETVVTKTGTLEYAAPENFMRRPARFEPDYWALGIIIAELVGDHPFAEDDCPSMTTMNVCTAELEMDEFFSSELNSLLQGLLTKDLNDRFGAEEVEQHPFFSEHLRWEEVENCETSPPLAAWLAERNTCPNNPNYYSTLHTFLRPQKYVVSDNNQDENVLLRYIAPSAQDATHLFDFSEITGKNYQVETL